MTDWTIRSVDEATVERLARELSVRDVTARCMAARGIEDASAAERYLAPRLSGLRAPTGLAGFAEAVERIVEAVQRGERVGCFGDYDVDGVTTAAVMTSYLRDLGVVCVPRVARRDAGYGFGIEDVEYFAEHRCRLVITGDCGTGDIASIRRANALGIQVIVIDHHTVPTVDPDHPHPAYALVNPFRADSTFPFQGMASVGLTFYIMAALRTRLRDAGYFADHPEPDPRQLLDLVALGTVADLVPLQHENRILTSEGLRLLDRRQRPGIDALIRSAGVDWHRPIDERVIGWKLAPRINAPGRLGDAAPALHLLLAQDEVAASRWAAQLEQCNDERRVVQKRILEEVTAMLGDTDPGPAVVVSGRGWPSGVVGIIAGRLAERYRRPAFVIAVDAETGVGRASARSFAGVNLYRSLEVCGALLERFGGHAAAAGFTVREDRIDALRVGLWDAVAAEIGATSPPLVAVDAEVSLAQIDRVLADELGRLAPFGKGNEQPVLVARGVRVADSRTVGDGSHLKLRLEDVASGACLPAIAFGQAESDPGIGAIIDAVFAPVVSTWRGETRVELEVRQLAPA